MLRLARLVLLVVAVAAMPHRYLHKGAEEDGTEARVAILERTIKKQQSRIAKLEARHNSAPGAYEREYDCDVAGNYLCKSRAPEKPWER